MAIFEDGAGTGSKAKVDSNNRIHSHAIAETSSEAASRVGDGFNVNTGSIQLTSASESGLLYLQNNGNADIHVTAVGHLLGNSTGGAGDFLLSIVKNPTGGTLITNAVAPAINQNKNTGSNKTLDADAYKGAEADTVIGGSLFYTSLLSSAATRYVIATGDIVIERGGSIAVKAKPQAGNTSMDIQVFFAVTVYNLT